MKQSEVTFDIQIGGHGVCTIWIDRVTGIQDEVSARRKLDEMDSVKAQHVRYRLVRVERTEIG